jgi:tetratricopeptide (TPR) repeat protein
MKRNGQIEVSVDIRNSGSRTGDEVVQMCVAHLDSKVERPIQELKALTQFQHAIRNTLPTTRPMRRWASLTFHLGDFSAAERVLRDSLEISAGHYGEAAFLLAAMLNDQDRFNEAEASARQGIAADSASWRGHYELARALAGEKHSAAGCAQCLQAIFKLA